LKKIKKTFEINIYLFLIDRLLLPKIDYIDCTWEELKSKLFLNNDQKKINRQCLSSSSIEQETIINNNNNTFSSMNNELTNV
jgi:hypothetical protein